MKKVSVLVIAGIAAPIVALALTAGAKSAQVLDVKQCTILDGNKKFYRTTTKNKVVYNKAGDILKCSAKKIPNDQGKAVRFTKANTGYWCSTGRNITTDWHLTVSKSGNATLTCRFKKK